ncbi:hypothetical protein TNCV_4983511 [Trichonephila clavipes]|nr:hypothetical protein TNCV_4983511 [Trichonephila clavipes]
MRIVYGRDLCNAAMKYGLANEEIARKHYTRAFGDGHRNFEPCGQVTGRHLKAGASSLNYTTPYREDVSALDRFNVHRCPTRRVFSGTWIELMTCLPWLDTLTTGLPQPPKSVES